MDVLLRGLTKETYRRLKAEAALRGQKISRAVQEAIEVWLNLGSRPIKTETDANNEEYLRLRDQLLKNQAGKFAAIAGGRLLGLTGTLEAAGGLVRKAGYRKGLIVNLGQEEPAGGEWLWSSIELLNA